MTTIVRVHRRIAVEYHEWFQRHAELAQLLEDELHAELIRRDGFPEGAGFVPDADPPQWVWTYSGDTVVRYTVSDETVSGWLFGRRVRTVLIIGIGDERPS